MSRELLAAELVGAQQHGPRGPAHLVLLAGVVVIALVVLGVIRWRGRRDAAAAEEQSTSHDRSAERARSTEKK